MGKAEVETWQITAGVSKARDIDQHRGLELKAGLRRLKHP